MIHKKFPTTKCNDVLGRLVLVQICKEFGFKETHFRPFVMYSIKEKHSHCVQPVWSLTHKAALLFCLNREDKYGVFLTRLSIGWYQIQFIELKNDHQFYINGKYYKYALCNGKLSILVVANSY